MVTQGEGGVGIMVTKGEGGWEAGRASCIDGMAIEDKNEVSSGNKRLNTMATHYAATEALCTLWWYFTTANTLQGCSCMDNVDGQPTGYTLHTHINKIIHDCNRRRG